MQLKVSIYGLTTEGFGLAKKLSESAEVYVVDEMLQTGFMLTKDLARESLENLMEEEPLLEVLPIEKAISNSNLVFFCPRLRRFGEEVLIEVSSRLRELSRYISSGCTVINCVPTGLGGNSENIQIIEKQSGLKVGQDITYCYFPFRPKESWSDIFASTPGHSVSIEKIGLSNTSQNILAAELEYIQDLLDSTLMLVSAIELNKKAREAKVKIKQNISAYIDQMVGRLFDLRAVQAREEFSETVAYLAGSILKNLESFSRYLADVVRDALRERSLRASKTKVVLLWSIDKYEMRPDRIFTSESIQQRLRDYVTDVDVLSSQALHTGLDSFDKLKSNIVVLCSGKDANEFANLQARRSSEMIVLHARPDIETFSGSFK